MSSRFRDNKNLVIVLIDFSQVLELTPNWAGNCPQDLETR